jgi:hypothetical protein
MTAPADPVRRSSRCVLKSPLAAPGTVPAASPDAFGSLSLASGRATLTDRERRSLNSRDTYGR